MTAVVVWATVSHLILGSTCVVWRAEHGVGEPKSDIAAMAVLLLWPVWLVARAANNYGWSRR
jgi:hypothetical protein